MFETHFVDMIYHNIPVSICNPHTISWINEYSLLHIKYHILHYIENIMLEPRYQKVCESQHCKVNQDSSARSVFTFEGLRFHMTLPGPNGDLDSVGFESVEKPGYYLRFVDI